MTAKQTFYILYYCSISNHFPQISLLSIASASWVPLFA